MATWTLRLRCSKQEPCKPASMDSRLSGRGKLALAGRVLFCFEKGHWIILCSRVLSIPTINFLCERRQDILAGGGEHWLKQRSGHGSHASWYDAQFRSGLGQARGSSGISGMCSTQKNRPGASSAYAEFRVSVSGLGFRA